MNIRHYEKNFDYTTADLLLVARRVGKLATYCSRIKDEASMIVVDAERRDTKKTNDQFKVTVRVELPQKTLLADSRKADVVQAVDSCVEKLESQVKRYKEMKLDRAKKGRRRA